MTYKQMSREFKMICKEYENNEFIQSKLSHIIRNLPKQLEVSLKAHIELKERHHKESLESEHCINTFHKRYMFFYHYTNSTKMYLLYCKDKFQIYNENDFWYLMFNYINKNLSKDMAQKCSKKIESRICKDVRQQLWSDVIPTSATIQSVLSLFYPLFFEKKEYIKLFLIQIGNALRKRKDKYLLVMNDENQTGINDIVHSISNVFGPFDISPYIKYRLESENDVIFMPVNLASQKQNTIYNHILEIIAVAWHYSKRYTINDFINGCNMKTKQQFKKLQSIETVIMQFIKSHINTKLNRSISKKDIFFLWKWFEKENKLPQIFSEKKLHQRLGDLLEIHDKHYHNISCPLLAETTKITSFIESSFMLTTNRRDEYDVDEILNIFATEKDEEFNLVNVESMTLAILHYLKTFQFTGKKISFARCEYWDKYKEVHDFIKDHNNNNDMIKTPYHAYEAYTNQNYKYKVNKGYFDMIYEDLNGINYGI